MVGTETVVGADAWEGRKGRVLPVCMQLSGDGRWGGQVDVMKSDFWVSGNDVWCGSISQHGTPQPEPWSQWEEVAPTEDE